jgi:hypothetical protein
MAKFPSGSIFASTCRNRTISEELLGEPAVVPPSSDIIRWGRDERRVVFQTRSCSISDRKSLIARSLLAVCRHFRIIE